jgi:hypothetical protein
MSSVARRRSDVIGAGPDAGCGVPRIPAAEGRGIVGATKGGAMVATEAATNDRPHPPHARVSELRAEYRVELAAPDADVTGVRASYADGVLEIHVPRRRVELGRTHFLHPEAEPV